MKAKHFFKKGVGYIKRAIAMTLLQKYPDRTTVGEVSENIGIEGWNRNNNVIHYALEKMVKDGRVDLLDTGNADERLWRLTETEYQRLSENEKKIVIDENYLHYVIPGMFKSAEMLLKELCPPDEDNRVNQFFVGIIISTGIIFCHGMELLLKYKIQQEGKEIKKDHNLYKLFNLLKGDSKAKIEKIFEEIDIIKHLYDDSDKFKNMISVEIILEEYQDAFTNWRYFVADTELKPGLIIEPLYRAAMSIYKSTPIYLENILVPDEDEDEAGFFVVEKAHDI